MEYQNLSLGVDNQKLIKFLKLKMLLLFHGIMKKTGWTTVPGWLPLNMVAPIDDYAKNGGPEVV